MPGRRNQRSGRRHGGLGWLEDSLENLANNVNNFFQGGQPQTFQPPPPNRHAPPNYQQQAPPNYYRQQQNFHQQNHANHQTNAHSNFHFAHHAHHSHQHSSQHRQSPVYQPPPPPAPPQEEKKVGSSANISAIPVYKFSRQRRKYLESCGTETSCSICFDDYCNGEKVMRLPCGHEFHEECVAPWLKEHHTCPLCRFEVPLLDKKEEDSRRKRMIAKFSKDGLKLMEISAHIEVVVTDVMRFLRTYENQVSKTKEDLLSDLRSKDYRLNKYMFQLDDLELNDSMRAKRKVVLRKIQVISKQITDAKTNIEQFM